MNHRRSPTTTADDAKPRRTARALQPPAGEDARRAETRRDVETALHELTEARGELAAIDPALPRFDRDRMLVEPLSRVNLVKRYCEQVLARYAWEPAR